MNDRSKNGHRKAKPTVVLPAVVEHDVPDLPDRDWHPKTREYWAQIWRDPISTLWTESDGATAELLADHMDTYHWARETGDRPGSRLTLEIRALRTELGLTPAGRAKLLGATPQKPVGRTVARASAPAAVADHNTNGGPQPPALYPIAHPDDPRRLMGTQP